MRDHPDPQASHHPTCQRPRIQLRCTVEQVWAYCKACGYESPRYRGERALEAAESQARRHEDLAAPRRPGENNEGA